MSKFRFKILFLIFILFISCSYVSAMTRGEIRYDITDLSINDSMVTFEGWALIGGTQNGRDQYGNNTHQEIAIRGVDENGNYWPDENGVSDMGGGPWNFYYQHYYYSGAGGGTKSQQAVNAYNGIFVSGWSNNCVPEGTGTNLKTQCFYENLGFSITLDVGDWDVENTNMYFEIRAYNDSYGRWTAWEKLGIFEYALENTNSIISNEYIKINTGTFTNEVTALVDDGQLLDDNFNLIDGAGGKAIVAPNKIYEIAEGTYIKGGYNALGRSPDRYKIWVDTTRRECPLQEGTVRTACMFPYGYYGDSDSYDDSGSSGYSCTITGNPACRTCASTSCEDALGDYSMTGDGVEIGQKSGSWTYITSSSSGYRGCWVSNYNGSPPYTCNGSSGGSSSGSSTGGKAAYYVWSSWMKSEGHLEMTVTGAKKCEVTRPKVNAACNSGGNSFSSTCEELTVKKKDGNNNIIASGNVSIDETAFASVILSPTKTFVGGGFKFGVLYYNKVSWDILKVTRGSRFDINAIMKDKLKSIETFKSGLKLQNLKFGNESIPELIARECKEVETDNSVTTMCMLYLPNSDLEDYSGKVTYNSGDNLFINNKYYTPLNWNEKNKYNITATIVGMDRFREDVAMEDSKDKTRAWTGDWETDIKGCSITLYSLLGIPKGNNYKYLFIYRPIDLNNPFPNRAAGMNWYDWYNDSQNKERLASSYDRLQYQITLDSKLVSEIKKYNKNELNNGGYLDWKTIDEFGNSSFVKEYHTKNSENIIE